MFCEKESELPNTKLIWSPAIEPMVVSSDEWLRHTHTFRIQAIQWQYENVHYGGRSDSTRNKALKKTPPP